MPDSISEQIVANVAATVETITKTNGYQNDIAQVAGGGGAQRYRQNGQVLGNLPMVVVSVIGEDTDAGDVSDFVHATLHLFLHVRANTPSDQAANSDAYLDSIVRDIQKALAVDVNRGLGSAVFNTVFNGHRFWEDEETVEGAAFCGAELLVDVLYQHRVGDPWTGV